MKRRYHKGLREPSVETAARFQATFARRRQLKIPDSVAEESEGFRQVVLSHVGRLTPKWPLQILSELSDDWGPVGMRRVMRALADLVERGQVKRTPEGYLLCRVSVATAR